MSFKQILYAKDENDLDESVDDMLEYDYVSKYSNLVKQIVRKKE